MAGHLLDDGAALLGKRAIGVSADFRGIADLLFQNQTIRAVPFCAAEPVPVRAVHHAMEHWQFGDIQRSDVVGIAGSNRRAGRVKLARVHSLVYRLCRDDGYIRDVRLFSWIRKRWRDADEDHWRVLRAQLCRDVFHHLFPGTLFCRGNGQDQESA